MADKSGKKVKLLVGDVEFKFTVESKAYDSFCNEFMPSNKVSPSHNFLMRCVAEDQKEALEKLCDDGYTLELANTLAEAYKPELEIKVKK